MICYELLRVVYGLAHIRELASACRPSEKAILRVCSQTDGYQRWPLQTKNSQNDDSGEHTRMQWRDDSHDFEEDQNISILIFGRYSFSFFFILTRSSMRLFTVVGMGILAKGKLSYHLPPVLLWYAHFEPFPLSAYSYNQPPH